MKKKLEKLELINPLDLKLTYDGYGEFPDSYKLTENGISKLLKIINNEKFLIAQQ